MAFGSGDAAEMNRVFQQIGELIGSVRGLQEKIDLRHDAAEKHAGLLQDDIRAMKQDLHELEQKQDAATFVLTEDISAIKQMADELRETVEGFRRPVEEFSALRAKAAGMLLVLGPIGAAFLWAIPRGWHVVIHMLGSWLAGGAE